MKLLILASVIGCAIFSIHGFAEERPYSASDQSYNRGDHPYPPTNEPSYPPSDQSYHRINPPYSSGEHSQTRNMVSTPQACESYIDHGYWQYRFNEWTLSLIPTDCGRYIGPEETGSMFYEIARKFSGSRFWGNDRALINQLVCHLVIARNKPEWNLEPWRPYVGYNNTVNAECNPTVPLPDPDFQ